MEAPRGAWGDGDPATPAALGVGSSRHKGAHPECGTTFQQPRNPLRSARHLGADLLVKLRRPYPSVKLFFSVTPGQPSHLTETLQIRFTALPAFCKFGLVVF